MDFGHKGRTASYSSISEAFPLLRAGNEPVKGDEKFSERHEKLWNLMNTYMSADIHSIQRSIVNHVEYTLASTRFDFDDKKAYLATAHSVRDRLIEAWNDTNAHFDANHVKRVAYLSLEFLMGRSLQNTLLNLDLEDNYREALKELGYNLENLYEQEPDAALGNGGLGRLAACFLDSMATLNLPAWGYGIRYTYGIFKQLIVNGAQMEQPDYWLTAGNPFEIERIDLVFPVRFYGHTRKVTDSNGRERTVWEGGEVVNAVAYDNPVPGYDTFNCINLRLWRAAPSNEFDLASFNTGNYMQAVEDRQRAETITHVLYPSDNTYSGKELRLKQQYFFVSATLRDIFRRFKRLYGRKDEKGHYIIGPEGKRIVDWSLFPTKNAVQLNDTHPSIGIPELMRLLMDEEGLSWDAAWDITTKTFAYTNHTILPEALEKWSVDMMGNLLPRHLEIIYDINWRFLQDVRATFGEAGDHQSRLSIIEEGYPKYVRMAHLAIVGSHAVNGVAAIHTQLLKDMVFPEFFGPAGLWPHKCVNKTNGITPRRWLNQCNRPLSDILSKTLGPNWLTSPRDDDMKRDEQPNLADTLQALRARANDTSLQVEWRDMKRAAKARLADYINSHVTSTHPVTGEVVKIRVDPSALFDVQVKRIHEYKRQQLNALYVIHRYKAIKEHLRKGGSPDAIVKRVIIFGGKSAPGYAMAKLIIRLIVRIGDIVNTDKDIGDLLKVVFIPNYNVSLAEIICPASDLSQHISTAGMEASGTSNMKFAINGGLIIGTKDGANIEIAREIGRGNMFLFGALASADVVGKEGSPDERRANADFTTDDAVPDLRMKRKMNKGGPPAEAPWACYDASLQAVLKSLQDGEWLDRDAIQPLLNTFYYTNDFYLVGYDWRSYLEAQAEVDRVWAADSKRGEQPSREWVKRSIMSTAGSGFFSTDRTILDYAQNIWGVSGLNRGKLKLDAMGRVRSFGNFAGITLGEEGPTTSRPGGGLPAGGSKGGRGGLGGTGSHSLLFNEDFSIQ